MTTKDTLTLLRDIKWRMVQIASGDYRACGVFAEDIAKDAMPDINELIRRASVGVDEARLAANVDSILRNMPMDDYSTGEIATAIIEAIRHHLAPVANVDSFSFDDKDSPYVFLQWKGTDACMDFHCECGAHCHFDGFFAYYVKCPHCNTVWQMPFNLFPRKVSDTNGHKPITLEPDEELLPQPPQAKGA